MAIYAHTATPTLSVAGAYASGDYIGPSTTPFNFGSNILPKSQNSVRLQSVHIVDKAAQAARLELWLFNTTLTVPTDNAAWSITDAHALYFVGRVDISAGEWASSAANSVVTVNNLNMVLDLGSSTVGTLYGALVSRGSPTYTDGDLQITIGLEY